MDNITVNGTTVACTDIDIRGECVAVTMLSNSFWEVFNGWVGNNTAVVANGRIFERCICTARNTLDMRHVNIFFKGTEVFYNGQY